MCVLDDGVEVTTVIIPHPTKLGIGLWMSGDFSHIGHTSPMGCRCAFLGVLNYDICNIHS